ncbi:hypothetical protein RchiOBHm_Chr2g0159411 [Rosa chinensis]|uniref:Uncharacterized protein n=1 Tax=Rosa chinensis TaxID=74649 RepID=A0A2P6S286_ROSCH|nr:hypothetical protein RchiOBHm_Chr2g0159411 [Rosa chinensis]
MDICPMRKFPKIRTSSLDTCAFPLDTHSGNHPQRRPQMASALTSPLPTPFPATPSSAQAQFLLSSFFFFFFFLKRVRPDLVPASPCPDLPSTLVRAQLQR